MDGLNDKSETFLSEHFPPDVKKGMNGVVSQASLAEQFVLTVIVLTIYCSLCIKGFELHSGCRWFITRCCMPNRTTCSSSSRSTLIWLRDPLLNRLAHFKTSN